MIVKDLQRAYMAAVEETEIPYAVLDVTFNPPGNGPWWDFYLFENNPADYYWGDDVIERGFARINLHWPINETGTYRPREILNGVKDHFSKGRKIGAVELYRVPQITRVIDESGVPVYSLTVWYQGFTPEPLS